MHHYFAKRMKEESRRIKTIFIVLTTAYITRAVVYLAQIFFMERVIITYIIYFVMYNFWEVIPLILIMVYHSKEVIEKPQTFEELLASMSSSMLVNNSVCSELSDRDPLMNHRLSRLSTELPDVEGTLFSNAVMISYLVE